MQGLGIIRGFYYPCLYSLDDYIIFYFAGAHRTTFADVNVLLAWAYQGTTIWTLLSNSTFHRSLLE